MPHPGNWKLAHQSRIPTRPLAAALSIWALGLIACGPKAEPPPDPDPQPTAKVSPPDPEMLNIATAEECGTYQQEVLKEPAKIQPVGAELGTQLFVAMLERCVPVFDSNTGWTMQKLSLRTYGYPRDHTSPVDPNELRDSSDHANVVWSAPGPTIVLNKATDPGINNGTRFKMNLYNFLAPQADPHACNPIGRAANSFGRGAQAMFTPNTEPNCFHGDNSTNFHFHGFHVSPQPHQDWVGLELLPFGSTPPEHAVHVRGAAVIGEYPFDVDPLRYTQAEGTHWYHAHKHGSTALQVLNGLVGTFQILGEFDKELDGLFASQGGLPDKVLVVQQVQERPPGYQNGSPRPSMPLINGMANPIIEMKPGEIQRWRFIGATMQASAQLEIGFPPSSGAAPEIRQIAMDGVQFAPQNYARQLMLRASDNQAGADNAVANVMNLDPGNRIDLLVQAPTEAGRHTMTFKMVANLHETAAEDLTDQLEALVRFSNTNALATGAAEATDPPLLTVVVEGEPVNSTFPTEDQFPKLPNFLDDLTPPFKPRTVAYQMKNQGQLELVEFDICGQKFDPACVNETLTLEVPEEWTLTNNSNIAHPFHIHTNPFQLVSDGPTEFQPPYIWRDTVAIPTGTPTDLGHAVIRYEATEFTGEFVNHCHILGHEDRGMMHNVQTVCPNGKWGKPTSDLSPECREGNYQPAAPKCEPGTCEGG